MKRLSCTKPQKTVIASWVAMTKNRPSSPPRAPICLMLFGRLSIPNRSKFRMRAPFAHVAKEANMKPSRGRSWLPSHSSPSSFCGVRACARHMSNHCACLCCPASVKPERAALLRRSLAVIDIKLSPTTEHRGSPKHPCSIAQG